jgi:hypothetical protein
MSGNKPSDDGYSDFSELPLAAKLHAIGAVTFFIIGMLLAPSLVVEYIIKFI